MSNKLMRWLLLALLTMIPLAGSSTAQQADEPVVEAVMFYLPTCPHCHEVINNHLPGMYAEFGDQFQLLLVDLSHDENIPLVYGACQVANVPSNRCGSVPMMFIGDTVLTGSLEIPQRAPAMIREGLAGDGIELIDVPALREVFRLTFAESGQPVTTAAVAPTVWDRLSADPVANGLAVMVLIGLAGSLGAVLSFGRRENLLMLGRPLALGVIALGVLLGGSLALNAGSDGLASALAWGATVLLTISGLLLLMGYSEGYAVPLVALAGISAAVYLSYVETAEVEAVCGLVGDCNLVQQSAYARLFGVLPVGVLGVMGYGAVLALWALAHFAPGYRRAGEIMLLAVTFGGALFSVYLTFLEPFVIGATCIWCLTSAVTMLALLWLVAPDGWRAWQALRDL